MLKRLQKFILISFIFHVVMSLTLVLAANLFQGKERKGPKPIVVDLVKGTGENPSLSPFKKTDKLPKFKKSDMKVTGKDNKPATQTEKKETPIKEVKKEPVKEEPKKEEPKKEEPKPKEKVASKNNTKKEVKKEPKQAPLSAEEKRRLETLKKMEKMASSGVKPEAAQVEKEGDGQSPEGALKVGQNELNAILVSYFSKVKKQVQGQWIAVTQGAGSKLKAEIVVQINSVGEVEKSYVETPSGNVDFDQSTLKAIDRASPFPPPPAEIKDQILTQGFSILFDPESVTGGSNKN